MLHCWGCFTDACKALQKMRYPGDNSSSSCRLSVDEAAVIREGGFPVIQVHGNRDGASALTYGIELCQHLHSTMLVLEGAHAGRMTAVLFSAVLGQHAGSPSSEGA